jgi:hypothetical protein
MEEGAEIELPCLNDYNCSVYLESWSLSSACSVKSFFTIVDNSDTSLLDGAVG